ncbi:MAG TPA: plastocyanin/azurin family copper-binding protein [Actinomycetota bacterium]|nr:plastocyanin/azurin family copper-binding protein [Actinomycetota bacterium]
MRRSTHIAVRTIGATAVVVLGALPALASPTPTPTAEAPPSASQPPSPSAEPSPSASPTAGTSPSTSPSAETSPSEAPSPSSTGSLATDPPEPKPADQAGGDERTPRQATASASVAARDDRFVPESITVEVGTTVVWRNEGQNPHTVTANDRAFDSGTLESGESFQMTFEEVGTVAYYCQIHGEPGSGMTGVVEVVAAPGDPTEEGTATSAPDVLARTGLGVVPLVLLALGLAVAGALALRVGSAREGR